MFGYAGYTDLDAPKVAELAAQGAQLIDVRTDAEFAQGAIEGAVHMPLHLLPLRVGEIARDKPVVFYCRTGARSAQACMWLAGQGYTNLSNLAGGIMAWVRSGYPVASLRQTA